MVVFDLMGVHCNFTASLAHWYVFSQCYLLCKFHTCCISECSCVSLIKLSESAPPTKLFAAGSQLAPCVILLRLISQAYGPRCICVSWLINVNSSTIAVWITLCTRSLPGYQVVLFAISTRVSCRDVFVT